MFWIPLFIIAISIGFIISMWNAACDAKSAKERMHFDNLLKQQQKRSMDVEMENRYKFEISTTHNMREQIICDFMENDEKWKYFINCYDGVLKAVAIQMAQHGKIPHDFMQISGVEIGSARRFGVYMDVQTDRDLAESYLLKLEDTLNRNHADTTVYCRLLGKYNWTPLREFIRENGHGSTSYRTMFVFLSNK